METRKKLLALASDIKLHHSVFALPWALLATVLASHRSGGLRIGQLLLILVCMVSGRTVAMVSNRLLDADFDRANPRTARRAVPSGRLSRAYMAAVLLTGAGVFIAAAAAFWFWYRNPWPIALALPVLGFLVGYSLMKRFTRLCHYYLGIALALAPLCAWLAITAGVSVPSLLMAGAVVFWTAGFDILYACQDYEFDVTNHLFSVPAKVGIARAFWVSRCSHVASIVFIAVLGWLTPELGSLFAIGTLLAAVLLVIEHSLIKPDDLSRMTLAFFTLNGVISLMLAGLGIIDIVLSRKV